MEALICLMMLVLLAQLMFNTDAFFKALAKLIQLPVFIMLGLGITFWLMIKTRYETKNERKS